MPTWENRSLALPLKCFPHAEGLSLASSKSKINPFSISFLYTPAASLPSGHWLPRALNTEVRICIEASYVVLASCVIEMRINIRAGDVTTWSTVLRGDLRPAVRDQAYGPRSPQVRSCWDGDKKVPWSTE